MQFQGFVRDDSQVGTRHRVAVVASVICSSTPVSQIARAFPGVVAITHQFGCAQVGDDIEQTRRSLVGTAANPNVSAVLVVGLGCETNQADEFAALIPPNKPIEVIGIQQLGGSEKVVRAGQEIVGRMIAAGERALRTPHSLSGLVVGVLRVDADDHTREAVHPAVGAMVDVLVEQGARVIVGLSKGLAPAGASLAERAHDPEVRDALRRLDGGLSRRRWLKVHDDWTVSRPWTAEERAAAMSEASLTGSAPISGLVSYAAIVDSPGLHFMAVSTDPVEAMAGLAAGGANVIVVASRRGLFAGSPIVPTMVVAPFDEGERGLRGLVDVQVRAGDALSEGARLLERVRSVASGEECALEREQLSDFAISQVGTAY